MPFYFTVSTTTSKDYLKVDLPISSIARIRAPNDMWIVFIKIKIFFRLKLIIIYTTFILWQTLTFNDATFNNKWFCGLNSYRSEYPDKLCSHWYFFVALLDQSWNKNISNSSTALSIILREKIRGCLNSIMSDPYPGFFSGGSDTNMIYLILITFTNIDHLGPNPQLCPYDCLSILNVDYTKLWLR